MENIRTLTKFMGGKSVVGSPRSEHDFIKIIRLGLPSTAFKCVVNASEISEDVIYDCLPIAKRTVARCIEKSSRFKPATSELLYRLSRVLVTAQDVLGDKDHAKQWLLSQNTALGGQRPIELLDTGIGFEDVMDVLRRIEYGVYS
ncbi:MAG: antitoxin [Blastopirellula sp.]|nr:MAG: antitoxin [Blastopirellula sp.]